MTTVTTSNARHLLFNLNAGELLPNALLNVLRDEVVVVMPPGHRLGRSSFVSAEDFARERLIVWSTPREANLVFREVLIPAGVVPARVTHIQLTEAIVELVKGGLGVSVLPRWTVAPQLEIVAAEVADVGWRGSVRGSTATWSGCCIPPGGLASFTLELQAADEPGDVRLVARQLYADGGRVPWPLTLTILPGREEPGSVLTVLLVAGIGLVVTVGLVVLLWLRKTRVPA